MEEQNQSTQLRQLGNTVEIIGTLKTKDLTDKVSKNGNRYIGGKLVILSKVGDTINEVSVKVMVMATSKLFKGIETVYKEWKDSDTVTIANADRVKITGEMTLNEYYNNDGKLIQFNEVKGVFFNRVEAGADLADKAIASIETVVESFVEKFDKDQLPTGDFIVNGFTIGYGNAVIELRNAIVKAELANSFMNLYQPGQTGRLTFKINNYVEIEEEEEKIEQIPTHGFGSTETLDGGTIKKYVNNLEIVGGDMPYFNTKEYTVQEIETAKQIRSLKLQTMIPSAPEIPQNTGFGMGSPDTTVDSDDTPDF